MLDDVQHAKVKSKKVISLMNFQRKNSVSRACVKHAKIASLNQGGNNVHRCSRVCRWARGLHRSVRKRRSWQAILRSFVRTVHIDLSLARSTYYPPTQCG